MFSLLTEDYRYGDGLDNAWMKTTIVERDKYGGGSVMVWGGILLSHSGKTELVTVNGRLNARRYCDEIIIPVVIPVHTMFSPFTAEQHLDTRLASACD